MQKMLEKLDDQNWITKIVYQEEEAARHSFETGSNHVNQIEPQLKCHQVFNSVSHCLDHRVKEANIVREGD